MNLDDIDWRAGEIMVLGKGGRQEGLPLPAEVGEAIVGYLRRGDPATPVGRCSCDRSPRSGRWDVVGCPAWCAVRAGAPGCLRSGHTGFATPWRVRWSPPGSGSAEIGQVLRQRSISSTAIYARVDLARYASWHCRGRELSSDERANAPRQEYLACAARWASSLSSRAGAPSAAAYVEAAGATTVTGELAIAWAALPGAVRCPAR